MWGVIMAKKKPSKLTNLQKEYNQQLRRVKRFYSSFKERGFFLSQKAQEAIDKIISKGFVSSKNKPKISTKTVQSLKNKTPEYFYKNAQYIDLQSGEVVTGEKGRWLRNQKEYQERQRSIGNKPFTKTRNIKKFVEKIFSEEPPEQDDISISGFTDLTEEEQKEIREYVQELRKEKEDKDIRSKFYSDKEDSKGNDDNLPQESKEIIENLTEEMHKWIPADTETLVNVRDEIDNFSAKGFWNQSFSDIKESEKSKLERILDGAIRSQGEDTVARRLQENADEINRLVQEILYSSGSKEGNFKDGRTQVNTDLVRFSQIIMGRNLTVSESEDIAEYEEELETEN